MNRWLRASAWLLVAVIGVAFVFVDVRITASLAFLLALSSLSNANAALRGHQLILDEWHEWIDKFQPPDREWDFDPAGEGQVGFGTITDDATTCSHCGLPRDRCLCS